MPESKIEDMIGKIFVKVEGKAGDEVLRFIAEDGMVFEFYHDRDCCESVAITEIVGDLSLLEGVPLLMANESSSRERPVGVALTEDEPKYGTETWTFYKFGTMKGYVDVRWLGESNGYYSESVDLRRLP